MTCFFIYIIETRPTRVQWANPGEKTYIIDQFKVDLWDPEVADEEIKIFIECQMVICELEAFFQSTIDQSMCQLPQHNTCTNRYDNLYNVISRRKKKSVENFETGVNGTFSPKVIAIPETCMYSTDSRTVTKNIFLKI